MEAISSYLENLAVGQQSYDVFCWVLNFERAILDTRPAISGEVSRLDPGAALYDFLLNRNSSCIMLKLSSSVLPGRFAAPPHSGRVPRSQRTVLTVAVFFKGVDERFIINFGYGIVNRLVLLVWYSNVYL